MQWLIFGDDWQRHPSTTQYIARYLPEPKKVLWVNSIGMRRPKLSMKDAKRAWEKLRQPARSVSFDNEDAGVDVIAAKLLPWHNWAWARRKNKKYFDNIWKERLEEAPTVLISNPFGYYYLPEEVEKVVYLKLDHYRLLPGVDQKMVDAVEPLLLERADQIWVTADNLLPEGSPHADKMVKLEQGVELNHFEPVLQSLPQAKVIGFYGLLAEWLDYDLILEVLAACPDWKFEFVGPVMDIDERLYECDNALFTPSTPYAELPAIMATWDAAWLPFKVDRLTAGVKPLKLREYLAAGLPVISTRLEALLDDAEVLFFEDAESFKSVLPAVLEDNLAARQRRRASVEAFSWENVVQRLLN